MNTTVQTLLLWCLSFMLYGQNAADYWKKGVAAFNEKDYTSAIACFKQFDVLKPNKTQTHFYLAQSYDYLKSLDSAIYFYKKTLELHESAKPNKAAMVQLSRAYLRKMDYQNAYNQALENHRKYPEDQKFVLEFYDVCMWAFLTEYQALSRDYLTKYTWSPDNNYIVNTINEQRIIVRNLRNLEGHPFLQDKRRNRGFVERWYGNFANEDSLTTVQFRFAQNSNQEGLQMQNIIGFNVLSDAGAPIYERVGALFSMAPFEKKEVLEVLKFDDEVLRYCACRELRSYNTNKEKKICLKDKRELVQHAVAENPAFLNMR